MTVKAAIREYGDHVYITTPVGLYVPEEQEIEAFAFAADVRKAAPNPNLLWLRGQYVEAAANRNGDAWTEGELAIKALTPVLCPITVMHDLRSAVGAIADTSLKLPSVDGVPRARIDTTLAIWSHRFPEIAAECRANAEQGTLAQSMECLAPSFECSECGLAMTRDRNWEKNWHNHIAEHRLESTASAGLTPVRTLRQVVFTGVGLIFGTRGARPAMPDAYLEVEELAAMHRAAHEGKSQRSRRQNTVEIEDSKYEALVSAKSEAEAKVTDLTTKLGDIDKRIEALEAEKVKAEEARDAEKARADAAEEAQRVAAMRDERMASLGGGFLAKLNKLETTAKRVREQAAKFSDEEWTARLEELEESLGVKRDAKADEKPGAPEGDPAASTAGLLFEREQVASSLLGSEPAEVLAAAAGDEPSPERRAAVMRGLIKPKQKQPA